MTRVSPLFSDQYQFRMFEAYVGRGMHETSATFELFYRAAPDGAPFVIACGIETALEFFKNFQFSAADMRFLKQQKILSARACALLRKMKFEGEVWAAPEGTPVLPYEPFVRITGPMGLMQIVESPLLNMINFETLIATKANRIARTAAPAGVTEFGMRRAHGRTAANDGARAAFVGGVRATSNMEAARLWGMPASGTMSHAFVMAFSSELDAFRAFAARYPDSAVLLVDTYDTLADGVPNAITVGRELKSRGARLAGIRIDSGDLGAISRRARAMLDQADLADVKIIASNDLDEFQIERLKAGGAAIDAYGVGTRLITAFSEPALGGVFKMTALRERSGWVSKMKTTSDPRKATLPGRKMIYRVRDASGVMRADIIAEEGRDISAVRHDLEADQSLSMRIAPTWTLEPLLVKVWQGRRRVGRPRRLSAIQEYCAEQVARLPEAALRLTNPKRIPCLRVK